jgi:iron(III) transport system ATP-binding protein
MEIADGKPFVALPGNHKLQLDTVKEDELKSQDVIVSIRPEELYVKQEGEDGVAAYVDDAVFLGLNTHYFIHFEDGEKAEIIQESQIDSIIAKGTKISLGVKTHKINVFDSEGKRNLVKGVVNDLDAYNGAR